SRARLRASDSLPGRRIIVHARYKQRISREIDAISAPSKADRTVREIVGLGYLGLHDLRGAAHCAGRAHDDSGDQRRDCRGREKGNRKVARRTALRAARKNRRMAEISTNCIFAAFNSAVRYLTSLDAC